MEDEFCECRPLGFLVGLPFALVSLVLSLVGAIIWLLGSISSCLCPCCICCAELSNVGMSLVKLPGRVLRWFISKIPC
ncbi:signaling peptide TAXIMIN 2-like [Gastrolobium bilobum]|uniref:signaling peptide TAXIMIN 2-like n=1 Tax=Gastrolobium bilobum TaxID=150636 RepID=UPI002AB24AB3|nr:signaling peptide TAXIMIN 2-like [Gastrolobium bilobum]